MQATESTAAPLFGAALEARLPLEAFALPMPAVALKREWRDDDFGSSPAGLEPESARKCNNCEITTLRLQHRRAAASEASRSSQELEGKLEAVLKKNERLLTVLKNLLKPRRALEELNPSFAAPRLFAADASKSVMMTQMKVLIAKILLGGSAEARENGHEPA